MSQVLWPAARGAVLGLLHTMPERELHLRELARQTGMAPATIHREVAALVGAGILLQRRSGHQVYFRANQQCPIFPELRGLALKTVGLAEPLREALEPFGPRIDLAFVYGSMADGTARPDSDIDLCIVGSVALSELAHAMPPLRERLGREVNPVVLKRSEFDDLRQAGDHFVCSILSRPRIDVVGCSDVP